MGKLKEEVRAGYKKTKLGWIPVDWEVDVLAEHSDFITKGTTPTTHGFSWVKKGVLFLRSECVTVDGFALKGTMCISEEANKVLKRSQIKGGDILMTITGNVGRVCIYPIEYKSGNINQHIAKIRINSLLLDSNYIYQYLLQDIIIKDYYRITTGQAYPQLSLKQVRETKILIPPLLEQKIIAEALTRWDNNIQTLQTLIDQKQLQKKWLMQQLLTGKKRLPGFDEAWEEHKLVDYFKERKETKCVGLSLLSVGEAGVYPQTKSNKKDTSNSDKSKYKRICKGDIGYNTMRMWQGRSALSSLEGIISPAYTVVTPGEHADGQFFAYLFKTPKLINKFYRNSQGLVSDTLNCKFKDFAIVKAELPPTIQEQKAIAEVLTKADEEIKLLEQKLMELKEQKKGLMQQLLTGKKRLV